MKSVNIGILCLSALACGEEEMPYSPLEAGCGFDDMEQGLEEPFDDFVQDKAAMPGAVALIYHGSRNGGSSGQECYYSGSTAHNCNFPGYRTSKVVWVPEPGYIDNQKRGLVRFGMQQALNWIETMTGHDYFTTASGYPELPIKYTNGPACPAPPAACAFASAGMTSFNPGVATNLGSPVNYVFTSKAANGEFNLNRIINWAQQCWGSIHASDYYIQQAGFTIGMHEFMHTLGFVHTSAATIMTGNVTCDMIGDEPTDAQLEAMYHFTPGDWANATRLDDYNLDR